MYFSPLYLDKIIPVMWQKGNIKPEKMSSQ